MTKKCLSCERHTLYRVVLQFSKEAVKAQRHAKLLEELTEKYNAYDEKTRRRSDMCFVMGWETPEFTTSPKGKVTMKGAVATIIIDKQHPNSQKRTALKFAKELKKLINPDDLEEGFIEIHQIEDIVELINWEETGVCNR